MISFGTRTSVLTTDSIGLVGVLTTFRVPDGDRKGVVSCPWCVPTTSRSWIWICTSSLLVGRWIFLLFKIHNFFTWSIWWIYMIFFFKISRTKWKSLTLFVLCLLFPCHILKQVTGKNLPSPCSNQWRGSPFSPGPSDLTNTSSSFQHFQLMPSCLLWRAKERAKENTYLWVSV